MYEEGAVKVACHLWDEGARRKAEEYEMTSKIPSSPTTK
jgi:hypothetical protein